MCSPFSIDIRPRRLPHEINQIEESSNDHGKEIFFRCIYSISGGIAETISLFSSLIQKFFVFSALCCCLQIIVLFSFI